MKKKSKSHSAKAIEDRVEQEGAGGVRRGSGMKAGSVSREAASKAFKKKLMKRVLRYKI